MTPTHPVSGACPDSGPEALAAWLRLTLIPGIGGETQRKLLAAFGLPQHIFSTSFSNARAAVSGWMARADGVADRGAGHGRSFFVLSFGNGGNHGIDFFRQSLCD